MGRIQPDLFGTHHPVRQVIDQIKLARQHGAAGIAFFDLDYTLVNDILPYLRLGLFKNTAASATKSNGKSR